MRMDQFPLVQLVRLLCHKLPPLVPLPIKRAPPELHPQPVGLLTTFAMTTSPSAAGIATALASRPRRAVAGSKNGNGRLAAAIAAGPTARSASASDVQPVPGGCSADGGQDLLWLLRHHGLG
jgi:hypothetical protein